MRSLFLCWLVACGKTPPTPAVPTPPAESSGPRTVTIQADVAGAAGVAATVRGALQRHQPSPEAAEATAILLGDGTPVYVSAGAPPDGWDWLLGTTVSVQGMLWERAPDGGPSPRLTELQTPMPADIGIGLAPGF